MMNTYKIMKAASRLVILSSLCAVMLFAGASYVFAQDVPVAPAVEAPADTATPATPADDAALGVDINDLVNELTQPAAELGGAEDTVITPAVQEPGKMDQKQSSLPDKEINPGKIPSILFTYWEYNALLDAKKSRGDVREPTEMELTTSMSTPQDIELKPKPPPGLRFLTLGGIVYIHKKEWTIWLNGKMVTPKALPTEAVDLVVHKDYVDIKWFDEYTNQIFPVRLRSHQKFNLDTRIFLPG